MPSLLPGDMPRCSSKDASPVFRDHCYAAVFKSPSASKKRMSVVKRKNLQVSI